MKRILAYILSSFIYFGFAQAQNEEFMTSGVVLNSIDSLPLEFVHVYPKNGFVGTYSNENGNFHFHYSDALLKDTLVFSRVGFLPFSIPLKSLKTSDSITVHLEESKNYLEEIVVYGTKDSVTSIVKMVLNNFRKIYPTKVHYLEGFYRELSTKGNTYTRLIEASVGVTENSYRKEETTSKVKVRQLRKSNDYREYSLRLGVYRKILDKAFTSGNEKSYLDYNRIYRLLRTNYAKANKGKIKIWAKEYNFVEAFDFTIDKVTKEKETFYYHIHFELPPESSSAKTHMGGEMTINMDDYAMVDWAYGSIPHPYKTFSNQETFFRDGKYHRMTNVKYSKINGRYYPTFFEIKEPDLEGTTFHINEESGEKEWQYNQFTFMVNRVVTRKKEFDRIKKREALEDDKDLYALDQTYDSAFWAKYNILLLDPLIKSAQDDLEKEKTLNNQFEKNGE